MHADHYFFAHALSNQRTFRDWQMTPGRDYRQMFNPTMETPTTLYVRQHAAELRLKKRAQFGRVSEQGLYCLPRASTTFSPLLSAILGCRELTADTAQRRFSTRLLPGFRRILP